MAITTKFIFWPSMNADTLQKTVQNFRLILEKNFEKFGPEFSNFPRSCCGAVSELLAAFLKDEGFGTFAYVSGRREDPLETPSHAWLENENFIIDVTVDQFSVQNKFLFPLNSNWHKNFSILRERREDGDFRLMCGNEHLHCVYGYILHQNSGKAFGSQ